MPNTLGARIRRARLKAGWSQARLGDKVDVSQTAISNWEQGGTLPPNSRQKLESVLGPLNRKAASKAVKEQPGEPSIADPVSSFGAWVRNARMTKNLSVSELAQQAGVSNVAIYNIENGKIQNPQKATRDKLQTIIGTIPKEVVDDTEEEQTIAGLGSLVDFDPQDKANWPKCSGIYVLYDVSQRPIYVGKADNISNRIGAHSKSAFWYRPPIVRYACYIEVKDKVLRRQLEQVLIKFLKSNAVINQQSIEEFPADDED